MHTKQLLAVDTLIVWVSHEYFQYLKSHSFAYLLIRGVENVPHLKKTRRCEWLDFLHQLNLVREQMQIITKIRRIVLLEMFISWPRCRMEILQILLLWLYFWVTDKDDDDGSSDP